MKRRGGGQKGVAAVSARFDRVADVIALLQRLGMPRSLENQLSGWLRSLVAGEAEQMEPELQWEEKAVRLQISAQVVEDDAMLVEFRGPSSLIEAMEAELDAFFAKNKKR